MALLARSGDRLPLKALALALGVWILAGLSVTADGGECASAGNGTQVCRKCGQIHSGLGSQSYGPSGLAPGFQGFGLGYHLGYGYGGNALGVGAEGGYPFYGGPGYPHPWPRLRRIGGITPFPYYGGPGYSDHEHSNYYGPAGPLVAERPVVTVGNDTDYSSGFGPFTGVIPYPESFFAPFTATASGGSSGGARSNAPPATNAPPAATAPAQGGNTTKASSSGAARGTPRSIGEAPLARNRR